MALELRDIYKTYGEHVAVDGLEFRVQKGEIFCLLGPNGAGKTTTIEMCEGFLPPSSGTMTILGQNPQAKPNDIRSRIGIMLQDGGGYSGIRVQEMLKLAAKYSLNPHDPRWLMNILGLDGVARTTYRRLSGGQQQRLSLALAIIGRPEIVFLDEPTAGLDAQSRLMVWELLRALKRDGVTIILTTHLMDEAQSLADHVVIIDHGHKVAEGSPAELMKTPRSAGISIKTADEVDEARFETDCGYTIQRVRPLSYRITAPNSPESIEMIARSLKSQKVLAHSIDSSNQNLEEVFLELTGRELRS